MRSSEKFVSVHKDVCLSVSTDRKIKQAQKLTQKLHGKPKQNYETLMKLSKTVESTERHFNRNA